MKTHRGFPNGTSAKRGASKTILCVDDEESGLFLRKLLLESAGFSVLTASNGKDGLAFVLFSDMHIVSHRPTAGFHPCSQF